MDSKQISERLGLDTEDGRRLNAYVLNSCLKLVEAGQAEFEISSATPQIMIKHEPLVKVERKLFIREEKLFWKENKWVPLVDILDVNYGFLVSRRTEKGFFSKFGSAKAAPHPAADTGPCRCLHHVFRWK